jgi:hypothetical protein
MVLGGVAVKRLAVLSSATLIAALGIVTLAGSQEVPIRAATKSVSSSTTPKRDRTRPFTFTTTGRVTPPPFCAPGVQPTTAGGGCVPLICPAAPADNGYCVPPPASALCAGKVTVRFKKIPGPYTISSRSVALKSDCTFRSSVTFRKRNAQRQGTMKVLTRFEGNTFLLPKNARTHLVLAG